MKIVSQETTQSKPERIEDLVGHRQGFIRQAAETGSAAHEVERELFKRLLPLGGLLLQPFFALLGDGDEGERVELAQKDKQFLARDGPPRYLLFSRIQLNRR